MSAVEIIPDNYFDCIMVNHVIEHLHNGEAVITELLKKLIAGGVIYIATPSEKSLKLPGMRGTLNFYDDPTHIKMYGLSNLVSLLKRQGRTIYKAGTRRSLKRILLLPLYMLVSLLHEGFLSGHVFWDLAGFDHYIIAITSRPPAKAI